MSPTCAGIGCPEQTIRDIIIADVNALFARRRATELITPEQQWWRSEPDTNIVLAASEKARELEDERRALLTRLLGTNWETGDLVSIPRPSRPGVVLDGPVLGALSAETKQAIQDVTFARKTACRPTWTRSAAPGRSLIRSRLAKLRQQTRDEPGPSAQSAGARRIPAALFPGRQRPARTSSASSVFSAHAR